MSNLFKKVNDWPAEAKHCGYRVQQVAMHLGISARWLEICLKKRFGKRPHELFAKWREREIRRLAAEGKTGKEMLEEVRFCHCSSLSRSLSRDGKSGLRQMRRSKEKYCAYKGRNMTCVPENPTSQKAKFQFSTIIREKLKR